jgi:transcription initiation protein SPT3
MSSFIDVKPNDDIIDSLGFLTFEMVSSLTEGALQIKTDLTALHKDESAAAGMKRKRESGDEDGDESTMGLFSLSQNDETPLEPLHIQEAFRRLQLVPQPMKTFRRGLVRTKISLI